MINFISYTLCILFGIYLIVDSWMLISSKDSKKQRWCFKAKYVSAMAAGFCLLFFDHSPLNLVYAVALSLAMWPNTFYGALEWIQEHKPSWHLWVLQNINTVSRRRSE